MKHKTLSTSDGNIIHVYDNVFSYAEIIQHYEFASNSHYKPHQQVNVFKNSSQSYFKCVFSQSDVDNFNFLSNSNIHKIIIEQIGNDVIPQESWILATTSSNSPNDFHIDGRPDDVNEIILLYHLNPFWNNDWHGETLFCTNSNECEVALQYIPGRVVVYNPNTPHSAAPISLNANAIRYVFVIVLKKKCATA